MFRAFSRLRHGERGASAVEFAIIFPVVLLVTLGIMEFALLLRDYNGVTNLARDASRIASANPRVGTVAGHKGPPDASFAYLASQVVESSGSAIPKDSIIDLWVYLANREGYPVTRKAPNDPTEVVNWKLDTNRTMTCSEDDYCVRYRWVDGVNGNPGAFKWVSGVWSPQSINACASTVPAVLPPTTIPDRQAVGVFIRVQHRSLFNGLFDTNMTVSDRNVVTFEPMRSEDCK
jgi:hypothetical protein